MVLLRCLCIAQMAMSIGVKDTGNELGGKVRDRNTHLGVVSIHVVCKCPGRAPKRIRAKRMGMEKESEEVLGVTQAHK